MQICEIIDMNFFNIVRVKFFLDLLEQGIAKFSYDCVLVYAVGEHSAKHNERY